MAGYANAKSTLGSGSGNKGTLYDRPSMLDGRGGQGGYGPDLSRIPNTQGRIPGGIAGSYGIDYPRIPKGNRIYNQPSHASSLGHAKVPGLGLKMANHGAAIGGALGATVGAEALTSGIIAGAGLLGVGGTASGAIASAGALSFAFPMVAGMAVGGAVLGASGAIFHTLSNRSREKMDATVDNSKTKSRYLTEKEEKREAKEQKFEEIIEKVQSTKDRQERYEKLKDAYNLKIPSNKSMSILDKAMAQHHIEGVAINNGGTVDRKVLDATMVSTAKELGMGYLRAHRMKSMGAIQMEDMKDNFQIDRKNTLVGWEKLLDKGEEKTDKKVESLEKNFDSLLEKHSKKEPTEQLESLYELHSLKLPSEKATEKLNKATASFFIHKSAEENYGKVDEEHVAQNLFSFADNVGKSEEERDQMFTHAHNEMEDMRDNFQIDNKGVLVSQKEEPNKDPRAEKFGKMLADTMKTKDPEARLQKFTQLHSFDMPKESDQFKAFSKALIKHFALDTEGQKFSRLEVYNKTANFAKEREQEALASGREFGSKKGFAILDHAKEAIQELKDGLHIDANNNIVGRTQKAQSTADSTAGSTTDSTAGEKTEKSEEIKPPTDKQNALFSKLSSKTTPDNKVVAEWERLSQGGELDRKTAYSLISELKNGGGEPTKNPPKNQTAEKKEIKPPTDKQNAFFSKLSSKATPDNKVVAEWERLSQGGELDRQTAYNLISELKNGGGEPNQPNLAEEQQKAVQAKQPEPQRTNIKEGEQEKAAPVPEKTKEEEKESSKETNKGKGGEGTEKEEEEDIEVGN